MIAHFFFVNSILEILAEKCLQNKYTDILKKLLKKAKIQRGNTFFRMVTHRTTPKRQMMKSTKKKKRGDGGGGIIVSRSTDMGATENVFNYVRTKLHKESQ